MVITLFLLGTIMGSFLFCVSENRDLFGRSRCDHCDHILGPLDLIPVFSFLFLKGRCRYCHQKLSVMYPVSEILCGFLYVLVWFHYGCSLRCLEFIILTSILLVISFRDLKTYTVPDICIVSGILNRIIFCFLLQDEFLPSIFNGTLMALFLFLPSFLLSHICRKQVLGEGDVCLVFMLSMYTGFYAGAMALLIASLCGLIVILVSRKRMIPFAPCICLGYLMVFFLLG